MANRNMVWVGYSNAFLSFVNHNKFGKMESTVFCKEKKKSVIRCGLQLNYRRLMVSKECSVRNKTRSIFLAIICDMPPGTGGYLAFIEIIFFFRNKSRR